MMYGVMILGWWPQISRALAKYEARGSCCEGMLVTMITGSCKFHISNLEQRNEPMKHKKTEGGSYRRG